MLHFVLLLFLYIKYETFKTFSQINEGCWALPNTVKKALKLKELLKEPIRAKDYMEVYNLTGDDALFDSFYKYKKKDDIRKEIFEYLPGLIRTYKKDPEGFNFKLSDEVLQILEEILKEHDIDLNSYSKFFDRSNNIIL